MAHSPEYHAEHGVRYDVEFTPQFPAVNAISQNAENALGITRRIPRDTNNIVPRIGLAWDPQNNGKTVVRTSYGMFYDHPLLALAFNSAVADGAGAPQFAWTGGAPAACTSPTAAVQNINATNIFQGLLGCLPPNFGYLPNPAFRFVPSESLPVLAKKFQRGSGRPRARQRSFASPFPGHLPVYQYL